MDKSEAIKLSKEYLKKVKKNNITFIQAWLFGSYAMGNIHENSDIDIAIVLLNSANNFDTEVKLMTLRTGEETIIEPHAFSKSDFVTSSPMVNQIMNNGILLEV